ncbi:MAG: hypothetical protein AB7D28_10080 [Candidatus Berkiella sp.]
MAAFGPRLGSFVGRAAQNLSRIANSKIGHFAKEVGVEFTADFATNTAMDMLGFNPSENVKKASFLKSALGSKAGFASQLIQVAMQGYETVSSAKVNAQQPVITLPPSSISQRLQDLSQSVSTVSNPRFSFVDPSKFTEQFLGLIESPQFHFALSQNKKALNIAKERRQSPLMFNTILDENNFFASHFSANKDADLSVKKDKEISEEPEVEKKSTPKSK